MLGNISVCVMFARETNGNLTKTVTLPLYVYKRWTESVELEVSNLIVAVLKSIT